MIKLVIAYDNEDGTLGEYFEKSYRSILQVFSNSETVACIDVCGLKCTEIHIADVIQTLRPNRFIFTALSHGNESELVANEVFVSHNNAALFSNSLFYSTACLTAKQLGDKLMTNGCLTFIGYSEEVEVLLDYEEVFYNCENFALISFLSNEESIGTSYQRMIENYNNEIDRLIAGSIDELIAASSLVHNRDSLIMLGDSTFMKNDFYWN